MFQEVIKNLVKRYVAAMIRRTKTDEGLTEENFKVCQNPKEMKHCASTCFLIKVYCTWYNHSFP